MNPLKKILLPPICVALQFALTPSVWGQQPDARGLPRFQPQVLDAAVQIGYGVAVADVNGDKLPDVLLADKRQFVWYQNPGGTPADQPWRKHLLAENLTPKDNVCIAAQDIDGDGRCEIAVGAEWNPSDTENSGAVFYLKPPEDRTQPWIPIKLHAEPTTHRMRWIKMLDGGGKPRWALIVVPLHGRGNKAGQGVGVRIMAYEPQGNLNTEGGAWTTSLVDDSLHQTHNLEVRDATENKPSEILIAGREGLSRFIHSQEGWKKQMLVKHNPEAAGADTAGVLRGAGEIRSGGLAAGETFLAAIEPMHGSELTVYSPAAGEATRKVLLDGLGDGHALGCADFAGTGSCQIVVGWRGNPERPRPVGIKLLSPSATAPVTWTAEWIDENGMACEDLQVADLNGDGRQDIVASGRSTRNLKIYWNQKTE